VGDVRRIRLIGLMLLGCFALGAITASTASAKAKVMELGYGLSEPMSLSPGAEFRMVNYSEITIETSAGNVSCKGGNVYPTWQGFAGEDVTNDQKTDTIALKKTYGAINEEALCSNTLIGGEAFAYVGDPEKGGPVGSLTISSNLKVELKSSGIVPDLAAFALLNNKAECYYTFTKLKTTVTGGTIGPFHELEINFTKQKLKFDKTDSSSFCPNKATLTAPFLVQETTGEKFIHYQVH
jgi:hypothetical protein